MLGPSALGHLIEPLARLSRYTHRSKQFFVESFDYLLFQSATIVALAYMFLLDKNNTLCLRDTTVTEPQGNKPYAVLFICICVFPRYIKDELRLPLQSFFVD